MIPDEAGPIAFVTGASGFVGVNVVEQLRLHGWRVVTLQRGRAGTDFLERWSPRRVRGDVCDAEAVEAAMPRRCDTVVHVAANMTFWPPRHREQYRVNVVGTRNVVEAALRREAARFVHVSSAAAFGLQRQRLTEGAPRFGHRSHIGYVRTKALAEDEVRDGARRGLSTVILNPTTIIGRYDTRIWLPVFERVRRGRLPGVAPGRTSYCQAAEVARVAARAASGQGDGSYLLGGPDATFLEVVRRIATLTGGRAPRRATPAPVLRAFARMSLGASRLTRTEPMITPEGADYLIDRNVVSSARAERELGYRPVSLDEALHDYHDWLRAEGFLPPAGRGWTHVRNCSGQALRR